MYFREVIANLSCNQQTLTPLSLHPSPVLATSIITHAYNKYSHVEPKSYSLQCFEVLDHSWISQCSGSLIPNSSPLVFIPFKTR